MPGQGRGWVVSQISGLPLTTKSLEGAKECSCSVLLPGYVGEGYLLILLTKGPWENNQRRRGTGVANHRIIRGQMGTVHV